MVDRELVVAKAALVRRHLDRISQKADTDLECFLEEIDRQEIVSFNLHLAIENCIDIASHLLSEEGLGVAGSASEMFYLLQENGYLTRELADKMSKASGLRNLIVHEYDKLDLKRLYQIAHKDIEDLNRYLACVFDRLGISNSA